MYCTGGIRCDIYSTFLKQRGYSNLYTLEGGIQVGARRRFAKRAAACWGQRAGVAGGAALCCVSRRQH
jgi:predicted sulfurtransferase